MSTADQSGIYTAQQAADALGFTLAQLRQSYIPCVDEATTTGYDKAYVDGLARSLEIRVAQGFEPLGTCTLELYQLQEGYKLDISDTEQARLISRAQTLVSEGAATRLKTFHTAIGGTQRVRHISTWPRKKSLMAFKVGKQYYLSADYANWLEQLFTWPTRVEYAARTNTPYHTVLMRSLRGMYEMYTTPDLQARINPENHLTVTELAALLGVRPRNIYEAIQTGIMHTVQGSTRTLISRKEAAEWHRRFTTINSDFTWLDAILTDEQRRATLSTKEVAQRLGVGITTVHYWRTHALLPFYNRSLGVLDFITAAFPTSYIEGLLRYAEDKTYVFRKLLAEEYKALCTSRGTIV